MPEETLTALIFGPDQPGIVAKIATWIHERGGNILHADQHRDDSAEIFFQRIEWVSQTGMQEADAFKAMFKSELSMEGIVACSSTRPKIVVMVSKIDHCFHDLILRWKASELNGDICAVISNHPDLEAATKQYGLPYYYIPLSKKDKKSAESKQLEIIHQHDAQLVVMARYMQILSPYFLEQISCPVINIHHSFLPAFIGAKPYHQAYERGVKLIGATAHYATTDLDEGPIIHQETRSISHRDNIADLIRKGRDLEKVVLARAVRDHLKSRILVYKNKTVVFD